MVCKMKHKSKRLAPLEVTLMEIKSGDLSYAEKSKLKPEGKLDHQGNVVLEKTTLKFTDLKSL